MQKMETYFVSLKKFEVIHFSILDLEIPSSGLDLKKLIGGIYWLQDEVKKKKTLFFLKAQLWLDFLFMPALYGSLFILCFRLGLSLSGFFRGFFLFLAWAQGLSWISDIIENIFIFSLLIRVKKHQKEGKERKDIKELNSGALIRYRILECVKWGFALIGLVSSLSFYLYFWISNTYSISNLRFLRIELLEFSGIFLLTWMINRLFDWFSPKEVIA
jgi:hypothetical protein